MGTLTLDSCGKRGNESRARHQFRSVGFAGRHRAVGRSFAERSIGDLFTVVYEAGGREERGRARSRLPTSESEHEHGERAAAIHSPHANSALADGRDGPDHAGDWRCHGRIAGRLPSPSFHPPPVGDRHPDFGRDSLRESPVQYPAAISGNHVARRSAWSHTASEVLLYTLLFVLPLVGWGMLSAARYPIVLYGPLHLPPILPHSVMLYAFLQEDAHRSRLPFVPGVYRPFWSDFVSHARRARRDCSAAWRRGEFVRARWILHRGVPKNLAETLTAL